MTLIPGTVERAYQLARSGECATVDDIRARLRAEGFSLVSGHLSGAMIQRALRGLCIAAAPGQPEPEALAETPAP